MKLFWTLFAIDVAVFLTGAYFCLVGLEDGTVSSFNAGLWVALVGVPAAAPMAGMALRARRRPRLATLVLALVGVPGLLLGGWMLLLLVLFATHPGAYR